MAEKSGPNRILDRGTCEPDRWVDRDVERCVRAMHAVEDGLAKCRVVLYFNFILFLFRFQYSPPFQDKNLRAATVKPTVSVSEICKGWHRVVCWVRLCC
jgi:hypothetical protein